MRFNRDGWVVASRLAKNQPLPEWFDEEPDQDNLTRLVLLAYRRLNTCRDFTAGGPIPWTAIQEYADRLELEDWIRRLLEMAMPLFDEVAEKYKPKKSDT